MVARKATQDTRLTWVARAVLFFAGLLFVRFFQVGVLEHQKFRALAQNQHVAIREVAPERGEIIANPDDYPLATNVQTYAVSVVPKNVKDKQKFSEALAPSLGISSLELFDKINNNRLYLPPISRGLSEADADKIAALNLVGVVIVPESVRFYPEGATGSHILGFVNAEGLGQYGIEGYYDEVLRGFKGLVEFEKDPKGRAINLPDIKTQARDGTTLYTTIDRNVQFFVETKLKDGIERFKANGGSIVVMDPKSGETIAMSSLPSFDPGNYKEAGNVDQSLFLNPATSASWEPGSVLKPVIMAAALDTGTVEPETEGVFSNYVVVQGFEIHTAQDKAFGKETMTEVLENSDNVAMVWLSEKLGKEKMREYLSSFGFGSKTDIDTQGEATGSLPALKDWRDINRATISFGQGIAMTPLQLTRAYAALGNHGKLVWPHFVKRLKSPDGEILEVAPKEVRQAISQESAAKISAMLVSVVERGHGKRAKVTGYKVAGKTGTAQVPDPKGGYYDDRHIGSFCGFAPASDPKFAMCVKLNEPKTVEFAESSAAPIFGEIAAFMLSYYGIPPSQ
jgi:stage V sporulation protein D (sporulation-specific penicillin-binding protein)